MLTMEDERMLARMERDWLEPPDDEEEYEWLDEVDREVEEAWLEAQNNRRAEDGWIDDDE